MTRDDGDERLREVIDMIVERCAEDGKLVTVHKHYRPSGEGFWYGFNLALGAVLGVSVVLLINKVVHLLLEMIP